MDNSLQELENELKRLAPRRPSAAVFQKLEDELGAPRPTAPTPRYTTSTSLRSWKWAGWSAAGFAAAIAFVAMLQTGRQAVPLVTSAKPVEVAAVQLPSVNPSEPINRYQPVKATSVLYDLKEEGLTSLPDQTEGRQVRYRYVDSYTWKNPATNASLRWSVPRDEVRFVNARLD